jgi:hypothetical protein
MRIRKVVKLCAVIGATAGCARPVPVVPDAGATAAVLDAGPTIPLALDLLAALPDGGTERHTLLGLETPVVSPVRSLVLESNRPLRNARIRVMTSRTGRWSRTTCPRRARPRSATGSTCSGRWTPDAGTRCWSTRRSGATFDDGTGKEVPEQRLEFRTSGERERPKPAPPKRKRRNR